MDNNLSSNSLWDLSSLQFFYLQLILFITSDLSTLRLIEFLSSIQCAHAYMMMSGKVLETLTPMWSLWIGIMDSLKKYVQNPFIPCRYLNTAKNKMLVLPKVPCGAYAGLFILFVLLQHVCMRALISFSLKGCHVNMLNSVSFRSYNENNTPQHTICSKYSDLILAACAGLHVCAWWDS